MQPESNVERRPEPWIGLLNVRSAPGRDALDGAPGAYVHCAALAPSASDALTILARHASGLGLEVRGVEWLVAHSDMSEQEAAEAGELASRVAGGGAVLDDTLHPYPGLDGPDRAETLKQEVEGFVERWIDGAVDRFGDGFDLADFAFVAEMRFRPAADDGEPETDIGWAYRGPQEDAADLFARAAAKAAGASGG